MTNNVWICNTVACGARRPCLISDVFDHPPPGICPRNLVEPNEYLWRLSRNVEPSPSLDDHIREIVLQVLAERGQE